MWVQTLRRASLPLGPRPPTIRAGIRMSPYPPPYDNPRHLSLAAGSPATGDITPTHDTFSKTLQPRICPPGRQMNIASDLSRPVSLNHRPEYTVPPSSGFDRTIPPPSPCRTCSDPFAFSAIRRRMISLAFPYYYRRSCQLALQPLSPFTFSTVCADDFSVNGLRHPERTVCRMR